jgi:peptide/nickel transport system permease protein
MSRQTDTRASAAYPTRAFTRTAPGFGRRALQHRSFVLGALLTTLLIAAALLSFVWTPGSA